jgi:hypothetical protein
VIPLHFIASWEAVATWSRRTTVEQDLIICRAVVEILSEPLLAGALAFRGGTALYQRRKGRDLFDLWLGLTRGGADPGRIVPCFRRFMEASGSAVSGAEFRQNLERKLADRVFLADLGPMLRPGMAYDVAEAGRLALQDLVGRL